MIDSLTRPASTSDLLSASGRIRVAFQTTDTFTGAGLAAYLRHQPSVVVLPAARIHDADVLVMVADQLTKSVAAELRRSAAENGTPVVLVCGQVTDVELFAMDTCRIVAALPRFTATRERLLSSILTAASGARALSAPQLREILRQAEALDHHVTLRAPDAPALTQRESETLRMIADGLGTSEIARRLNYSERTVKNIVYGITRRLNLRNRTHLVAFAIRSGLI